MEIRPAIPADLDRLADIDATIESAHYLHVERAGQGIAMSWRIEERPLRSKLIESNPLPDEMRFSIKQVLTGAEEGIALVGEHEQVIIACMTAVVRPENRTLRIVDLRVDYDHRRQGLGTVLLFRTIQEARDRELRAVTAQTLTHNAPAAKFLARGGFELTGLDSHLHSNHDLVKEKVALFWYAALD